jgi:hypothetical protein
MIQVHSRLANDVVTGEGAGHFAQLAMGSTTMYYVLPISMITQAKKMYL